MSTKPSTSDSIRALRAKTRELVGAWQIQGRFEPRSDAWMRGYDLEISRDLAKHGLLGLSWPVEYGGAGLPSLARLAVTEELLRVGAPIAAHWFAERQIGPAVIRYGSPGLKSEILPGILSADITFSIGMSETESGSDLASLSTRAIPTDGGWLITGSKIWTTHAHRSTHLYILARTSAHESRQRGLSEFVVRMDSPGISVSPIVDMAGEHHFNEVHLDGIFASSDDVLGEIDNGWQQVTEQLSFERGGAERYLSTYPLMIELLHIMQDHSDRACAELIGRLISRLIAIRRLAWEITSEFDAGRAPVTAAAQLKFLGTAFEKDVVEAARYVTDVVGGTTRITDSIEDATLCTPAGTIRGGASEVLLTLVARSETRK